MYAQERQQEIAADITRDSVRIYGQVEVLAELASILLDPDRARQPREAGSAAEVVELLRPRPDDAPDEEGTP
jgi:hypothetical protein